MLRLEFKVVDACFYYNASQPNRDYKCVSHVLCDLDKRYSNLTNSDLKTMIINTDLKFIYLSRVKYLDEKFRPVLIVIPLK